jgi:two-component system chemotaxis sensor kinase CheA
VETNISMDPALRAEFIDESLDMLSGLEGLFIDLENDPEDIEIVQAIFRPVHSIKGNSSFFDFPKVKSLAHEMETILDFVRKKTLGVSQELIGAQLAGIDQLKDMLERGRSGMSEIDDESKFNEILERVKATAGQDDAPSGIGALVAEKLAQLKAKYGADNKGLAADIDTLLHELQTAGDATLGGGASATGEPVPLVRIKEILKELIEDTLSEALSTEVENALKTLVEEATEDSTKESLASILDTYHTFIQAVGFDALLQEIILDGLSGITFPAAEQSSAAAGTLPEPLLKIRAILAEPLEEVLPEKVATEIHGALEKLLPLAVSDAERATIESALDDFKTFVDTVGFDGLLQEIILESIQDFQGRIPTKTEKEETTPESVTQKPSDEKKVGKKDEPAKTMRVSEMAVDTFLGYVGELLVIGDMFSFLEQRLGSGDEIQSVRTDFRRINETFSLLSDDLQKSIMSIRLVPVRTILQRVPRLIRDIAAKSEKEIDVSVVGEEVEVDKSLIDLLDAPLTHMVRNAADHGIEMPDVREQNGKQKKGNITVTLSEVDNNISMVIEDDGAGLNYDAIHKKGLELGLVKEGQRLTDDDILNLLFASGVSTAEKVTDVSGRGVGMDVVKGMVEEGGGSINVSTNVGKGTRFELLLPKSVTTQIVSGFLIESGGQRFVFPMAKVLETTRVPQSEIHSIAEAGHCFTHHDKVVPLVNMEEMMDMKGKNGNGLSDKLVVTLHARKAKFGVSVDKVVGVQQVVLRQIEGLVCASEAIAGGALMGDSSVALVIDVDKMYREFSGT